MDTLSRLLTLHPLRTELDIHCHVGAPWEIKHAAVPLGTAPYHLVVSGGAWLDADGQEGMQLHTGDVVVLPKGGAHSLHVGDRALASPLHAGVGHSRLREIGNDGPGPATDLLCGQFVFHDGAASALLGALPAMLVVRSAGRPDCAGLVALIAMLKVETETTRPGASAVIAQLSSALFALLIRAWLEQAATAPGLFGLLAERRLVAALRGMLEAPEKPWALSDMAAACHMSRATFARLFHKIAGATPATVLMQTRMAHAARCLAQGVRTVGAIGEAVGYQSEAAFNRAFKRHFGIGPGQYRRNASAACHRDLV